MEARRSEPTEPLIGPPTAAPGRGPADGPPPPIADRPPARRVRGSSRIARTLTVVVRLTPFVLSFLRDRRPWVLFGGRPRRPAEDHRRRAEQLTAPLAALGPTFIKLAQLMSARADIFPEPYLSAIGRLQDQVPADPPEEIVRVIEEELGAPVASLFTSFDRTPVAAASLGQVHGGTLG